MLSKIRDLIPSHYRFSDYENIQPLVGDLLEDNNFTYYDFGEAGPVKTATEVGVRAIQDHKVIEWNTCWKCRLSEDTDDI